MNIQLTLPGMGFKIECGNEFADLCEMRARHLGYESIDNYIAAVVRIDVENLPDHSTYRKIAGLAPHHRARYDTELIERANLVRNRSGIEMLRHVLDAKWGADRFSEALEMFGRCLGSQGD